jgi:hypothetical protein
LDTPEIIAIVFIIFDGLLSLFNLVIRHLSKVDFRNTLSSSEWILKVETGDWLMDDTLHVEHLNIVIVSMLTATLSTSQSNNSLILIGAERQERCMNKRHLINAEFCFECVPVVIEAHGLIVNGATYGKIIK